MKSENRLFVPEDVVFTGVREEGRSFGKHLEFYVYSLNVSDLPRRVAISSFVHSTASAIFERTGVPAGAYVDNYPEFGIRERPFIIATAPLALSDSSIRVKAVDQIVPVEVYETGRKTTLVNLYFRGQRFAVQTLWSRILQQSMKSTEGFAYEYDVVHHGISVRIDKKLLRRHLPDWADKRVAQNALDVTDIDPDSLEKLRLKGCDFSLFEPQRYVDLDPRVGLDGTAYALTPVRTRMDCPSKLNLSFLKRGLSDALREWSRSYNRTKVYFRIEWQGRRLKPNSVHLETVIPQASEQDVQRARDFFTEQGLNLSPSIESLIEESMSEGLAVVRPHYLSEDYRRQVTFIVPLKIMIPIITQENMRLFSNLVSIEGGTKRLSQLYQTLTRFNSEATACFNHAVANAITNELHPILRWENGETIIRFIPGPVAYEADSDKRTTTSSFNIFALARPEVAVLNRETGMLEWIDAGKLYDVAVGKLSEEPIQILACPEKFEQRTQIALIYPEYRSNFRVKEVFAASRGPNICKGIMLGDFDYLDPDGSKRSWHKSPIKYIDQKMKQMYSFFGYDPSLVEVEDYKVDDLSIDEQGNPSGYIEQMRKALQHGVDLFVVFLPSSPVKHVRDRVYYATYAFSFEHGKPIMHYRPKTWKGFTELYGLAYSHLANMARRFGGEIFRVDTRGLWGRIKTSEKSESIKNPLCVYVDFGPWYGQNVGLITSTGADFSRTHCHITLQADNEGELFERIDKALKGLIEKGHHDFLLTMRDSYFRDVELKRINDVAGEVGIPTLPISTIKSGGLSAWKFRKRYAHGGLAITAPHGIGLSTPDDTIELFPHNIELEKMESGGLWRSIRLKKEQPYPATIRIDGTWIADLGMILASTAGYLTFPTRMKYPEFLRKADRLSELIQNSVFPTTATPADPKGGILTQFNANLID